MATRNCIFVLNNPEDEDEAKIISWDCKYIVFGREIGESGTPHLQGYVEWPSPKRFTTLKALNERIHWEARKGTAKQAADYCKKDGNFFERGSLSNQGHRSDLDEAAKKILQGDSLREIALEHPTTFVRYHKGLERLQEVLSEHRTEAPKVYWLWGLTGVGKTKRATESHASYYIKDGTQWWNGYEHEEAIVIDDFDGKWPFRDLIRLMDRYKYQGQTKGGYVKITSPHLYITCEFPPSRFWSGNALGQILRRVTEVTEVGGNTKPQLLDSLEEQIEQRRKV